MCSFGSCQMRFEFLSQFRKVRNAFECFVTQVQTRLPKTKCVWPMKINVICTVPIRYRLEHGNLPLPIKRHTMDKFGKVAKGLSIGVPYGPDAEGLAGSATLLRPRKVNAPDVSNVVLST